MLVHAVDLGDILGEVNALCSNAHGDASFDDGCASTHLPLWHIDAVSDGGVHSITTRHAGPHRAVREVEVK